MTYTLQYYSFVFQKWIKVATYESSGLHILEDELRRGCGFNITPNEFAVPVLDLKKVDRRKLFVDSDIEKSGKKLLDNS